ncbi:hypothetical protein Tco_0200567 [Tanacetum coccineum]
MVKPEPVKKTFKKELLKLDEELAFKVQAEEEEEERLTKEKAQQVEEANIAWDDVYDKIDADYQTKLVEESSKKAKAEIVHESCLKRAGEELEQESSKKQKLEEVKESEELKQCLEIILDDGDDVTIDATPLSTKSPTIVDYKIYKEGKKSYFQIIRAEQMHPPLKEASSWCSIRLIRRQFACKEVRILTLELVFSLLREFRFSS